MLTGYAAHAQIDTASAAGPDSVSVSVRSAIDSLDATLSGVKHRVQAGTDTVPRQVVDSLRRIRLE